MKCDIGDSNPNGQLFISFYKTNVKINYIFDAYCGYGLLLLLNTFFSKNSVTKVTVVPTDLNETELQYGFVYSSYLRPVTAAARNSLVETVLNFPVKDLFK